ncbi:MAG: hypothetical protein M1598_04395 [Actinobacteria bacterium]|nr:hypothetical protein [Actinomycetota bacterium]
MDRKKRNLVLGLVLIIVGVFGVGVNLFQGGDWEDWTVLGAIAAALLAIYWVGRKLGFLIAGAIVAAVATFVFLTDGLGSEGGGSSSSSSLWPSGRSISSGLAPIPGPFIRPRARASSAPSSGRWRGPRRDSTSLPSRLSYSASGWFIGEYEAAKPGAARDKSRLPDGKGRTRAGA